MAYLASLTRMSDDMRSGCRSLVTLGSSDAPPEIRAEMLRNELRLVLEMFDAGLREVRADVEQLIVGGEW